MWNSHATVFSPLLSSVFSNIQKYAGFSLFLVYLEDLQKRWLCPRVEFNY
jgi:hypothetical protein